MNNRIGYVYGFSAYLCWGTFPLFFMLLAAVNPLEAVPWRVLTALGFCVIVVTLMRAWGPVAAILRSPRMLGWFTLSTLLLYANWQIFVYGVVTGHIIETALGYFINPLITVLIGVFVRSEKLRKAQWLAVGVAAVGVLVSAIAYGKFPFIAIGLALSFGLYGAVRKQVSEDIDALTGLTVETLIGSVIAVIQLVGVFMIVGHLGAFDFGPSVTIPLLLSGMVTAIPLLLFAAGTRRLPLSHMGFIQFLTPVLSFFTGYFIFGEPMPLARWIGFIAVWIALIVLVADMIGAARGSRHGVAPILSPDEGSVENPPATEPPSPLDTGELPVQSGP